MANIFDVGLVGNILKKINETKKKDTVSRAELRNIILNWYEPFRVFTRKKDGSRYTPEAFTVAGPSGRAVYDYSRKGYMLVQVIDHNGTGSGTGWRTIILDNVTKIEYGGRTYLVR